MSHLALVGPGRPPWRPSETALLWCSSTRCEQPRWHLYYGAHPVPGNQVRLMYSCQHCRQQRSWGVVEKKNWRESR